MPDQFADTLYQARLRAQLPPGIRLKLVEGNLSPAVCGLFRPVILLPRLLVEQLSAEQLHAVLLHEVIHLRRKDIWVNCAQALLQIVYWWHPLVWVANARIRRVREEAVDDAVMLALAGDAETYAPTLLEVAKLALNRPLTSLGIVGMIGIMESRSALRQRIERLVHFRAPRKAGLTLLSLCGIFVFSAVAVPMGQGPARVENTHSASMAPAQNFNRASTIDYSNNILTTYGGIMTDSNFRAALKALKQRIGVENLGEPEVTTVTLRSINQIDQSTFLAIQKRLGAALSNSTSQNLLVQMPPPTDAAKRADELVREGKLLYESGRFNQAEISLNQAISLDPDNQTAFYYSNLVKQAKAASNTAQNNSASQEQNESTPNAYATNTLIHTGPGRQAIVAKLSKIRLNVSYNSLPLNEVLKQLAEQCKLRDPEHKGINFLINSNPNLTGPVTGIDPTTGQPVVAPDSEQPDVGSYIINIPSLTDVRLADVLDALVLVAQHPIQYSIQDFGVMFYTRDPETPQLFTRTFRVDPNTFYSGLESVSAKSFGAVQSGAGGRGDGGQNQNNGATVGGVNAFPGAGNTGGNTGGGNGNDQGGSGSLLNNPGVSSSGAGGGQNQGGLAYITTQSSTPSALARAFFTSLGVNLTAPAGKSVFFNDRLGMLFVKATASDLDTIARALQVINQVPPQIHIKARFYEVPKGALADFGKYLKLTGPATSALEGVLPAKNTVAAMQELQSITGFEDLGEQEATNISGRQVQMRTTEMLPAVTNWPSQQAMGASLSLPQTNSAGFIVDIVPYFLADGYTINLAVIPAYSDLDDYMAHLPHAAGTANIAQVPFVISNFTVRRVVATVNIWDNQTFVWRLPGWANGKTATGKELLMFITATVVDPVGNRVHSDDELPFAQREVPTQPLQVPTHGN